MSDSMEAPGDAVAPGEALSAGEAAQAAPVPEPYEPAAPAPLGVERVPTGDAEVDARLERLADVDLLPADGHLEVYEDVHRGLRDTLTALDAQPPGPRPDAPRTPHDLYDRTHNHRS
ncbi:hypothetical protein V1460_24120 [Streptomyces sp. SCSIO 30461]|uniref:hypothetical protein n=1 Tax=Streptomyces sp. SCSIO 30461 TaxID=3118085 RepID=UPI0030CDA187